MSKVGKRAFAEACMRHSETELLRAEAELEASQSRVSDLSRELVRTVRATHAARLRLDALRQATSEERTRRERDFEDLLKLPRVKGASVDGGVIRVLTEPVILEHEGNSYLIGEFALELDLAGDVKVRNLKNTITKGGWEHPHVQGKVPCLGNLRDGVLKLLGELELVPLVSMLIQFLESYVPETAYCGVESWRVVDG